MKRVTIKDIANAAGVSPSAVSFVLNGRPNRLSEETRRRIVETAKKYRYQPNRIARSMVTKSTKILAVVVPDLGNIFFSSLVKALESHCKEKGYVLITASSDDCFEQDKALLAALTAQQVDGLFIIPSNASFHHLQEAAALLEHLGTPYVLVDRVFDGIRCDKVFFDNQLGAYEAVSHLIAQGHRKIGCIRNPANLSSAKARFSGYLKAMGKHGLVVEDGFVAEGDYHMQSGYAAAKLLLPNTTCVFSGNDMMALGMLKYLEEQGICVPRDYSIVGYDDAVNDFLLHLELTSVSQDVHLLGKSACQLMFKRLAAPQKEPEEISLKPKLMVRKSVRPMRP